MSLYNNLNIQTKVFIIDAQNELELICLELSKLLSKLSNIEIVELAEIVINESTKLILEDRLGFILSNKNYTRVPITTINLINYMADVFHRKVHNAIDSLNVNRPIYINSLIENRNMHLIIKWSNDG